MAIIATDSGGQKYENLPDDSYIGRCYQMVHIGTIEEEYKGKKKMSNKVMITFEIPSEMRQYGEDEPEKPVSLSKEYSIFLSENANLRKDLESWRGKAFTEDEAKAFDLEKLVGAPCMLGVIEKEVKGGAKKNRINTISKLHKDLKCPPQINPSKILSYDKFDLQLFESLPEFLQVKVKSSLEYKIMIGEKPTETKPAATEEAKGIIEDEDSDIPF